MAVFLINNKKRRRKEVAYIISEISNQWGGSMSIAEQMILQSKIGGADAVKIQLFGDDWKPERFKKELGKDYLSFDFSQVQRLVEYAKALDVDFFASPFDEERLDWCIDLGFSFIKIGNGVYKKFPDLVKKAIEFSSEKRRVLISLDGKEIEKGCPFQPNENVSYLYTERKYPACLESISMPDFSKSFVSGYSDHAFGISACLFALARGAEIIEKHFTLSKSWQSASEAAHLCSMDFNELRMLRAAERDFFTLRKNV